MTIQAAAERRAFTKADIGRTAISVWSQGGVRNEGVVSAISEGGEHVKLRTGRGFFSDSFEWFQADEVRLIEATEQPNG